MSARDRVRPGEAEVYGTSCAAPLTVANVRKVTFFPFLA